MNYDQMLDRLYQNLNQENARRTLPKPKIYKFNSKYIWENFPDICSVLNRKPEHLYSYYITELRIEGTLDSKSQFYFKSRINNKQILGILQKYIKEYVICPVCKSNMTKFEKDPVMRITYLKCSGCETQTPVTPIR